jgi:hypothetical protein
MMNDNEIKRLFDYIESRSHKDGVITIEDIKESIGPDLDNDGKVTDKKLYRKITITNSKYTGREIKVYEYTTVPPPNTTVPPPPNTPKFEAYVIDGVHVSERDLVLQSELNRWLLNFKDEIKEDGVTKEDKEITFEEFKKVIKSPYPL